MTYTYTDFDSSFMHSEKTVDKCHLCGNFEEEDSDETKLILVREEKICKGCLTCEDCAEEVVRVFNPMKGKFAWEQFNEMGHKFEFWNKHLQATPIRTGKLMDMKVLISLFDHSGNASRPFEENGWEVIRIDLKNGNDIMDFNQEKWLSDYFHSDAKYIIPKIGIIAMIPCTAYALCGNRHKKSEARKLIFEESQKLVAKTKEIIDFFAKRGLLVFWQVENPRSDIHKKNPWLGKITQRFDPCDFAGYDPILDNSRYNKDTWLWGNFNLMEKKRLEPLQKDNPGWKSLGGKSERTKELRSITPLGFAYAFYEANKL